MITFTDPEWIDAVSSELFSESRTTRDKAAIQRGVNDTPHLQTFGRSMEQIPFAGGIFLVGVNVECYILYAEYQFAVGVIESVSIPVKWISVDELELRWSVGDYSDTITRQGTYKIENSEREVNLGCKTGCVWGRATHAGLTATSPRTLCTG